MSSPDCRTRRAVLAALGLAGAALLGGCQVRPLYAERAAPGGAAAGTVDALGRIAIERQTDRLGQSLMNELIFALRGGAALADPVYTLKLVVTQQKTELNIQEREEVPTSNLVAITVSYTLTENVTGRVVAHGTTYDTVTYDFSSQRFANLRAQRDAEDRAAKTIAQEIRLRLAGALAGTR